MKSLRLLVVLVISSWLLAATAWAAAPSILVTITATPTSVPPGGLVTFAVTEKNDGDVVLTGPTVVLTGGLATVLVKTSASFRGGDSNGDGNLDPGETWLWNIYFNPSTNITITATGHGTDPAGNDVTYPADPDARASATVTVTGSSTPESDHQGRRWIGYWKNHPEAWAVTGYDTGQLVKSAFTRAGSAPYSALGDATLMEALGFGGGNTVADAGAILLRAGVAASLNAASPGAGHSLTPREVALKVNAALNTRDRTTILRLASRLAAE